MRLERITASKKAHLGVAILLTNDRTYWSQSKTDTVDAAFRVHESRSVTGQLEWDPKASEGTKRGRKKHIALNKKYTMNWHDYSIVHASDAGKFRFVLVLVDG